MGSRVKESVTMNACLLLAVLGALCVLSEASPAQKRQYDFGLGKRQTYDDLMEDWWTRQTRQSDKEWWTRLGKRQRDHSNDMWTRMGKRFIDLNAAVGAAKTGCDIVGAIPVGKRDVETHLMRDRRFIDIGLVLGAIGAAKTACDVSGIGKRDLEVDKRFFDPGLILGAIGAANTACDILRGKRFIDPGLVQGGLDAANTACDILGALPGKRQISGNDVNHLLRGRQLDSIGGGNILRRRQISDNDVNHLLRGRQMSDNDVNHLLRGRQMSGNDVNHLLRIREDKEEEKRGV